MRGGKWDAEGRVNSGRRITPVVPDWADQSRRHPTRRKLSFRSRALRASLRGSRSGSYAGIAFRRGLFESSPRYQQSPPGAARPCCVVHRVIQSRVFGMLPIAPRKSKRLVPRSSGDLRGTTSTGRKFDMQLTLNSSLFLSDLRHISERIRILKQALGAPWCAPMAAEQRELQRSKQRATELCALRAFSRGKLHLTRAPRGAEPTWDAEAYHRRVAERLAPSYSLVLEQSA